MRTFALCLIALVAVYLAFCAFVAKLSPVRAAKVLRLRWKLWRERYSLKAAKEARHAYMRTEWDMRGAQERALRLEREHGQRVQQLVRALGEMGVST